MYITCVYCCFPLNNMDRITSTVSTSAVIINSWYSCPNVSNPSLLHFPELLQSVNYSGSEHKNFATSPAENSTNGGRRGRLCSFRTLMEVIQGYGPGPKWGSRLGLRLTKAVQARQRKGDLRTTKKHRWHLATLYDIERLLQLSATMTIYEAVPEECVHHCQLFVNEIFRGHCGWTLNWLQWPKMGLPQISLSLSKLKSN